MGKLLIVDGSNLLFQMFYGMPARIIGANGKPIQGTLGFVGALGRMIRMVKPSHVAVLFDGQCENVRKELDEDYKANRPDYAELPEEEIPFSQLPDIYAALDVMGIAHRETTCCETDDWIAAGVHAYAGEHEIVISSQDSDFFQLISETVHILRYRGDKTVICDIPWLRDRLGIAPSQYAAYKSLTGDTADNIRGAEGIGPKTAAELMNRFADLESLIAGSEQIHKPSVRASVQRNAERLRKNYQLICLDGSAEFPFSLEQMRYIQQGLTTKEVLERIGL